MKKEDAIKVIERAYQINPNQKNTSLLKAMREGKRIQINK